MRKLGICVLVLALAGLHTSALADEAATAVDVKLPRDGLSIKVPPDWAIHQYDGAVLRLTRGAAVLIVNRAPDDGSAPAARLLAQAQRATAKAAGAAQPTPAAWEVAGATAAARLSYESAKEVHLLGAISLSTGPGFDVECRAPRETVDLQKALQVMLGSVRVQPFAHPERHVDWRDGWTLDLPSYWSLQADPGGVARFQSARPPHVRIRVEARADDDKATPEAAARALIDAAHLRLKAKGLQVALDESTLRASELMLASGVRARRLVAVARGTGGRATGLRFQLEAVATPDLRLLLACTGSDDSVLDAGRKVALTLRKGTHPGARAEAATPQGFKRKGAPPVQFVLPAGWKLTEVKNPMRLATVTVPGAPQLSVVIYWFGAGKGGDLASNLARWKSQVRGGSAPKEETIDVAPHVRATILDTHGMYVADVQPGAGHPEIERGQRVLATFLAVPHGPLFMKLIGPVAAVGKVVRDYGVWIRSFRVVRPGADTK